MKENCALKKRVGIWIRVSTEDQAKGESPEHHEQRAREYAKFNEWTVVEKYDLAGVSGKTVMENAEAKRMIADVKRGHITGQVLLIGIIIDNHIGLQGQKGMIETGGKSPRQPLMAAQTEHMRGAALARPDDGVIRAAVIDDESFDRQKTFNGRRQRPQARDDLLRLVKTGDLDDELLHSSA